LSYTNLHFDVRILLEETVQPLLRAVSVKILASPVEVLVVSRFALGDCVLLALALLAGCARSHVTDRTTFVVAVVLEAHIVRILLSLEHILTLVVGSLLPLLLLRAVRYSEHALTGFGLSSRVLVVALSALHQSSSVAFHHLLFSLDGLHLGKLLLSLGAEVLQGLSTELDLTLVLSLPKQVDGDIVKVVHHLVELDEHAELEVLEIEAEQVLELFLSLCFGVVDTHSRVEDIQHLVEVHDLDVLLALWVLRLPKANVPLGNNLSEDSSNKRRQALQLLTGRSIRVNELVLVVSRVLIDVKSGCLMHEQRSYLEEELHTLFAEDFIVNAQTLRIK